ncbi:winged helix-turn-helix domain-containing protein [Pleionea sp. CnH1-48]|uniref:winged helix-turn-helix domain-containing protein n=1 Tax=Pleionea sp. CnH1-48 TaxID=2954494 RepID=UPI002097DA5B|nr:winged helix-turn-helix domain-containing protein [Pleionea sp. CnH1-48]MCO7225356.1 winged helix-turn-helix domain-containing protein [Pleionea sp. CnH1-48]
MTSTDVSCVIYPDKGEVFLNEQIVQLRPKSFELLLLLASKPDTVFSKAEILQSIWGSSIVDEQVVFQSVNEVRKELGIAEAIKTFPRRGYSWTLTNTTIEQSPEPKQPPQNLKKTFSRKPQLVLLALLSVVILIGLYFSMSPSPPSTEVDESPSLFAQRSSHKGVLILPFDVQSLDSSQKWIRYGAMEGLINKLTPNSNVTVFQLEDIIDILSRLPMESRDNAEKIFKKSGASIILKTSTTGVPGDYNIIYSIYRPDSLATKAVNVKNINAGIAELVSVFEETLHQSSSIDSQFLNTQFQNDLMIRAIQFIELGDYQSAAAFLESAVANDSQNVYALYLLSTTMLKLGDVDKTLEKVNTALSLSTSPAYEQYENRFLYFKGSLLLAKKEVEKSKQILIQAESRSKSNKDWLYYSYSHSMLGKAHQLEEDYETALTYFNSAMQYQELIQCPMGIAQGYMDLAEFYLSKQNQTKALENYHKAEKLVSDQKLIQAEPILNRVQKKLATAQVHQ